VSEEREVHIILTTCDVGGTGPLFRRSAIPKVHYADTRHSEKICVEVRVRVKIRIRVRIRFRSALGLGLGLAGIVNIRNSGPESRREGKG